MSGQPLLVRRPQPHATQPSLFTVFRAYFIVGLTAFGMAILQKLKAVVMRHRWLTEGR